MSGRVLAPFVTVALGAAVLKVLGTRSGSTVPLSVVAAAEAAAEDEEVIKAATEKITMLVASKLDNNGSLRIRRIKVQKERMPTCAICSALN